MVTLKYHHLFSPIRLGNVTLRNRIIASPTGGPAIMPPQYITRETAAFWELRAKGGASVVTLGDNVVDSETGLMHPHKMRIDDSGIIPSLTNTARYITQYGAVASLELQHDSAFPATTPKRVLVVGGGPAGLMAACTAAQRGHHVILCEASDRFGGLLKCEAHVPFKKELYDFVGQLRRRAETLGVDIRANTFVTPEYADSLHPDVLVCAVGSDYCVPPIPGTDSPKMRCLPDLEKEGPASASGSSFSAADSSAARRRST